jgi:hypothetical protein
MINILSNCNTLLPMTKEETMNENQPILFDIKLNIDQINVILSTMGKLPYETIAPLMESIQSQATAKLQELQAAQSQNPVESDSAAMVQ